MPAEHTADVIASLSREILEDFNLSTANIITAVTDNASVMIAACRELGVERSPCLAHLLQLVVAAVLTKPTTTTTASSSSATNSELVSIAKELGVVVEQAGDEEDVEVESKKRESFKSSVYSKDATDLLDICSQIVSMVRTSLKLSENLRIKLNQLRLVRQILRSFVATMLYYLLLLCRPLSDQFNLTLFVGPIGLSPLHRSVIFSLPLRNWRRITLPFSSYWPTSPT